MPDPAGSTQHPIGTAAPAFNFLRLFELALEARQPRRRRSHPERWATLGWVVRALGPNGYTHTHTHARNILLLFSPMLAHGEEAISLGATFNDSICNRHGATQGFRVCHLTLEKGRWAVGHGQLVWCANCSPEAFAELFCAHMGLRACRTCSPASRCTVTAGRMRHDQTRLPRGLGRACSTRHAVSHATPPDSMWVHRKTQGLCMPSVLSPSVPVLLASACPTDIQADMFSRCDVPRMPPGGGACSAGA